MYLNNYFINSFIDNGISNYLLLREDKPYKKEYMFEMYVVRALIKIYGKINIINPYKIKSENSFKCNLLMYGLTVKEMETLFQYFDSYELWLNSENVTRTDLTTKIEKILIDMIVIKGRKHQITEEEMNFFNNFFDPVDNTLAKIHASITFDNDVVPNYWKRKKLSLNSKVDLVDIRSDLLASNDYATYGISIQDVEKMSHDQVQVLNDKIQEKERKKSKNWFHPKKIIISSGSGFVDTLMLLSIMTTEIMIGLVLAFYFMRG